MLLKSDIFTPGGDPSSAGHWECSTVLITKGLQHTDEGLGSAWPAASLCHASNVGSHQDHQGHVFFLLREKNFLPPLNVPCLGLPCRGQRGYFVTLKMVFALMVFALQSEPAMT